MSERETESKNVEQFPTTKKEQKLKATKKWKGVFLLDGWKEGWTETISHIRTRNTFIHIGFMCILHSSSSSGIFTL